MEFEGHSLFKIDKQWLFDLTTFIGYKVSIDENNNVTGYRKAFIVIRDKNTGNYCFENFIRIPVKVQRKSIDIIQKYLREALLDNAGK